MTFLKEATSSGHRKYIPILDWGTNYQRDWLRPDILTSLTTAVVVIPKERIF